MQRTVKNFTENEYKQWAQNKNFTAFANIMSGLNFSANKIVYTMYYKNITNFQKVETVANSTALETEYPGGAKNLEGVIYTNIQNYVGGKNLPLITGQGDTGARLDKTPAAARYAKCALSSNFKKLINKDDFEVLPQYFYEGKYIEYQFIPFSLPLILINGSTGIGSGHAQNILPRSVDNIKKYIQLYLNNKSSKEDLLLPYYNGFKGKVERISDKQYTIKGCISRINKTELEITDMPPSFNYKSAIKLLDSLEEKKIIKSYDDLCDPKKDTFLFKVKMEAKELDTLSEDELLQKLKLIDTETENYTCIDEKNRVIVFKSDSELIQHYIKIKLEYLDKRKDYQLSKLDEEIRYDLSKYTFIKNIVENKLIINKRKKADIEKDLESIENIIKKDDSFDYLLNMNIMSLTEERMNKLLEDIKTKKSDLDKLKETDIKDIWKDEIKNIS